MAVAVSITLVLFLITYLVYTPGFLFNDDPMMMLLVAGVGRVVEPTIYLNYTHVFIGSVLKHLYSITMDFPWYALYLIATLFAAHATFLYLIIKRNPCFLALLLYLVYFFLVAVNLLINLQFTISSILVSIAGFLLMVTDDDEKRVDQPAGLRSCLTTRIGVGFLLIVLGSLIRFDGMILACLLVTPVFIQRLRRPLFPAVLPPVLLLVVAVILCFGLARLNSIAYSRDSNARGFHQRNKAAIQFLNYNAERRVDPATMQRIINESGLSLNDFAMFKTWFFMNDQLYNESSLKEMVSQLPNRNVHVNFADVYDSLQTIWNDAFVHNCIVCFAFLLVLNPLNRRNRVLIIAILCLIPALVLYLIHFAKPPPPRVYFAIISYLALVPLMLAASHRFGGLSRFGHVRLGIGLLLFLVVIAHGWSAFAACHYQSRQNRINDDLYRQTIRNLDPNDHQLYFSWTGAPAWQLISPFGDLRFLENLVAPDSRQEPSTKAVLDHFGIDDIYVALSGTSDVFLVVHSGHAKYKLAHYREYMREHYEMAVTWKRVAVNPWFEVYDVAADAGDSQFE